ncbi:hypothetical protein AM1_E0180 (plasmid) [Acaryochloris marina MBIC11017]|uniref:Uncharacterized protein n=1 Tax=Acaryochloris marina (strain MBIC 11017) TaxID=329726 RepID=A8ZPL3_ACAM1|nr:hypothetical protein AM1_E0180 [Acaryochloris marina MBIC11017]
MLGIRSEAMRTLEQYQHSDITPIHFTQTFKLLESLRILYYSVIVDES